MKVKKVELFVPWVLGESRYGHHVAKTMLMDKRWCLALVGARDLVLVP